MPLYILRFILLSSCFNYKSVVHPSITNQHSANIGHKLGLVSDQKYASRLVPKFLSFLFLILLIYSCVEIFSFARQKSFLPNEFCQDSFCHYGILQMSVSVRNGKLISSREFIPILLSVCVEIRPPLTQIPYCFRLGQILLSFIKAKHAKPVSHFRRFRITITSPVTRVH